MRTQTGELTNYGAKIILQIVSKCIIYDKIHFLRKYNFVSN